MKQTSRIIVAALVPIIAPVYTATPYFSIRSQGVNAARELVGWQTHINQPYKDVAYASLSFTPEYSRSFRGNTIACCLFSPHISNCNCPIITISGRDITNRGVNDWLADYFGLPSTFKSRIQFDPSIKNFSVDVNLFVGFDSKQEGLFFRMHTPLTYTTWNLNFSESIEQSSTDGYDPGYFAPTSVSRDNLLTNATKFFVDGQAPVLGPIVKFKPLNYSKFPKCARHKTDLADIEMALGWNFKLDNDYHLGAALRWSIPTGNKPKGVYLFEPIVGSGGHWKLGLGLTGHYCVWRNEETDRSIGFWCDLNLQHLFNARQCRTFDLCGKPNSRYMLAQKLGSNTQNLHGDGTLSDYQFANEFTPIANLTTTCVKVSAALEADLVFKFAYMHENIEWDAGYELWARSHEKICAQCPVFTGKTWALKGDAAVYGFTASIPNGTANTNIALAATESEATINRGMQPDTRRNNTVDNAQEAEANNNIGILSPVFDLRQCGGTLQVIYTSIQPVLLKDCNIDYNSCTRSMSHKIFTNVSYTWLDCDDVTPFCGIGASVELSGTKHCNCALSQWAIWFKGGVTFN